jgi:hypothetical protein
MLASTPLVHDGMVADNCYKVMNQNPAGRFRHFLIMRAQHAGFASDAGRFAVSSRHRSFALKSARHKHRKTAQPIPTTAGQNISGRIFIARIAAS